MHIRADVHFLGVCAMDIFVTVLELIGTVAFAASGALTAMKKRMDLMGIIVLGLVTAVGGGILRDIILGATPPFAFRDPLCACVAVATSLLLFIPYFRRPLMRNQKIFDYTMFLMDSVGLGVFTAMGIWIAKDVSPDFRIFLLVFVGVITGVGGGVLRDVLAGETPYIFVKHIYACASIVGALVCALVWRWLPDYVAMLSGVTVVLVIRILSAHYHWNLPRVNRV